MIKFINKDVIQNTCTSKPSKNGGTVYMTDILPIVASEHQKPLCRIYSTTDNYSAPIWDLYMRCQNCLNEVSKNINTNFDIVEDTVSVTDINFVNDVYVIMGIPFNGIITSINTSQNVDMLNGCFTRVTPHEVEGNKKQKYSKIVYFVIYIRSGEDFKIEFTTENMSFGKGKKRVKTTYNNTFAIENINEIDENKHYTCTSEAISTEPVEDTENHTSPKFSTLLNARVDATITGRKDTKNKTSFTNSDKPKFDKKPRNGNVQNGKGGSFKGQSHHNTNHGRSDEQKENPNPNPKAMNKLNKFKNKFGE